MGVKRELTYEKTRANTFVNFIFSLCIKKKSEITRRCRRLRRRDRRARLRHRRSRAKTPSSLAQRTHDDPQTASSGTDLISGHKKTGSIDGAHCAVVTNNAESVTEDSRRG